MKLRCIYVCIAVFSVSVLKINVASPLTPALKLDNSDQNITIPYKPESIDYRTCVKIQDWHIILELNRKHYKAVYLAKNPSGKLVIVKQLFGLEIEESEKIYFQTEYKMLEQLNKNTFLMGNKSVPLLGEYVREGPEFSYLRKHFRQHRADYFTMEYIEGPVLDEIDYTALDLRTKVLIIIKLAERLHGFHDYGYVHRDIKPSNGLLRQGLLEEVVIIDWECAYYQSPNDTSECIGTQESPSPFTLEYASPEAISKNRQDKRSDFFSLGVIAYEILVGMHPFCCGLARTCIDILEYNIKSPEVLPSAVSLGKITNDLETEKALVQCLFKALEKDPGHRFQTGREMADAFRQAIQGYQTIDINQVTIVQNIGFAA